MPYNPNIHHRRSIRLREYDYTSPGKYFVTICTQDRNHLFGEIINGKMILNRFGELIKNEWIRTSIIRPNIIIDEFIIMPDHFHGILIINQNRTGHVATCPEQRAPTIEQFGKPISNSIPTIIRLFKSTTTKQINLLRNTPGTKIWMRNYYEHIIRNNNELNRIRQYIRDNPSRWSKGGSQSYSDITTACSKGRSRSAHDDTSI